MTKLAAAEWLLENVDLTPDQEFVVKEKVAEKAKQEKRAKTKATITENIKNNAKENKETDPRVAKFIEEATAGKDSAETTKTAEA